MGLGVRGVLLVTVLVAATPAVVSLHEAPDAEDVGLDNQHLVDWIYNHSAPLADDFRTAFHESFAGVNRSNATQFYEAADNYTNWTTDRLDQLEHDLDPSHQSLHQLHANVTQLTDPSFAKRHCAYPVQYAQPGRLDVSVESLYDRLGLPASEDDLTQNTSQLSDRHDQALVFAFDCLDEVAVESISIFADLNKSETSYVLGNASKAENYTSNLHNLTSSEQAWLVDYLNTTDKLDSTAAANASSLLFDITDQVRSFFTESDRNALSEMVPIDEGRMLFVGSSGNDTYRNNAIFTLDLNGSDIYLNNAGGGDLGHGELPDGIRACEPSVDGGLPCEIAAAIDLGPMDDVYTPEELKKATVGSSFAGVGFLLDEGGSNYYETMKWVGGGQTAGAGTVVDLGESTTYNVTSWDRFENATGDVYNSKTSLGAGQTTGRGVLIDIGGDDNVTFEGVDGVGYGSIGSGVLINAGGNDTYANEAGKFKSPSDENDPNDTRTIFASGVSTGSGEIGGLGIVLELGGDDVYQCRAPVLYACQGGGLLGMGLLLDSADDDQYLVENATPPPYQRWGRGQGQASARGVGILGDRGGADDYESVYRATGSGSGLGIGVTMDTAGNDSYSTDDGASIGYGLVDIATIYTPPTSAPGLGLLWDSEGSDSYSAPDAPSYCGQRADASLWMELDHESETILGLGADIGSGSMPTCI